MDDSERLYPSFVSWDARNSVLTLKFKFEDNMTNIELVGKLIYANILSSGYSSINGTIALNAVIKEAITNLSLSVNPNDMDAVRAAVLKYMDVSNVTADTDESESCDDCDDCTCDCEDAEDIEDIVDEFRDDYYDLDNLLDEVLTALDTEYSIETITNTVNGLNTLSESSISDSNLSLRITMLVSRLEKIKQQIPSFQASVKLALEDLNEIWDEIKLN